MYQIYPQNIVWVEFLFTDHRNWSTITFCNVVCCQPVKLDIKKKEKEENYWLFHQHFFAVSKFYCLIVKCIFYYEVLNLILEADLFIIREGIDER